MWHNLIIEGTVSRGIARFQLPLMSNVEERIYWILMTAVWKSV